MTSVQISSRPNGSGGRHIQLLMEDTITVSDGLALVASSPTPAARVGRPPLGLEIAAAGFGGFLGDHIAGRTAGLLGAAAAWAWLRWS
jgi:hypothetical protein